MTTLFVLGYKSSLFVGVRGIDCVGNVSTGAT